MFFYVLIMFLLICAAKKNNKAILHCFFQILNYKVIKKFMGISDEAIKHAYT